MLGAFAAYTREQWSILPESRATELIQDAEALIPDLHQSWNNTRSSPHDDRLFRYMYIEALRSLGHVKLLHAITRHATDAYSGGRPIQSNLGGLNEMAKVELEFAIRRLEECKELGPNCRLYCDLAEAYLLLGTLSSAQAYARHATLQSDSNEYAYYIAAESYFLEGTTESIATASKYANSFAGPVTLEEFASLRRDLSIAHSENRAA
jgi:predicted Zn-dependent protease